MLRLQRGDDDSVRRDPPHAGWPKVPCTPAYSTALGRAFHLDALQLFAALPDDSVSLVVTSPPFALQRKKKYGNVSPEDYSAWFAPFAEQIYRVLKPDGSFVLELGGSWNAGSPTRSLYQYELILNLGKRFHLAQDFYWYNPARLPTPAEWVTVRRTRVKDAVSLVWWLSKSEHPQADNRRVLRPYSDSMKRLLDVGYKGGRRPSEHVISADAFSKDNGGAIPPNVLEISNTRSSEPYLTRCKAAGMTPHPARFPQELPAFFIKFLTSPGDLVMDPFAGSNVTGAVAESLGRRWITSEMNADYIAGSRFRFVDDGLAKAA
jgi:site-specific DNA-methyltransferase (cytosine-N4-specific)